MRKWNCILAVVIAFGAMATRSDAQPDLGFENPPTVAPTTITEGGVVSLEFGVRNHGTSSAGGFHIGIKRFIGTHYIHLHDYFAAGGVGAGETEHFNIELPLTQAGGYMLFVVLDEQNVLNESDETNNRAAAGLVTVEQGTVDLRFVHRPVANPTLACAGNNTEISFEIRNDGSILAGPFDVTVERFFNTQFLPVMTKRVSTGIQAGEQIPISLEVPIGSGANTLRVILDSAQEIEESDEANVRSIEGVVTGVSSPDLYFEETPTLSETHVEPGARLLLSSWVLGNSCSIDAIFFKIGVYLSEDELVDSGDSLIDVSPPLDLAAGDTIEVGPRYITVPSDMDLGEYQVILKLDTMDWVNEFDEDNNFAILGFVVPTEQTTWGGLKSMYR